MQINGWVLRAILVALPITISGCATGSLFCNSEHEDQQVAALMRETCAGDRGAAMQLGLWFESREDYAQAIKYYRVAAAPHSGQTYIYVPAAGKVAGYVMPVDTGPRFPGNAEAQFRLGMLYFDGRGVDQNSKKAQSYFRQAAEQGHADARAWLSAHAG